MKWLFIFFQKKVLRRESIKHIKWQSIYMLINTLVQSNQILKCYQIREILAKLLFPVYLIPGVITSSLIVFTSYF